MRRHLLDVFRWHIAGKTRTPTSEVNSNHPLWNTRPSDTTVVCLGLSAEQMLEARSYLEELIRSHHGKPPITEADRLREMAAKTEL